MVPKAALIAFWVWLVAGPLSALPLRVAVLSDFNGSYGSVEYEPRVAAAVARVIALRPDLVISTGDMVAGQRVPHLGDDRIRAMWRAFHATVSDPLAAAGIPFVVTPGNHDASAYRGFARERRLYAETWEARRPAVDFVDGEGFPFFYVFDLGGVRFASLDATVVGALPADQMRRLEAAMQGGGETRIVFSHLPLWPFAIERETEVIGDSALAALMRRAGIDLHLSGHHHAYYPGASDGLALISQACIGAGARRLIGTQNRSAPGFTLLEIDRNGRTTVSAFAAPDFSEPIDATTLPREIVSPLARIERLDLADLPDVRLDGGD